MSDLRPDTRCAWCKVRAQAIPEEPPILWGSDWYHRRGCYPAARLRAAGKLPESYVPITELPEWAAS